MVAPIIKQEDDETVVMADEDASLLASDPPPPALSSTSTINKDLLVRLNQDQFLKLKCKYPPGCYIYFSITTKRSSFEACRGVVMAIYIDLESKEIVYEIIETATTKQQQQHYNTNDNGLMVEEERLFLLEKDLAFAPNFQVRVEGKDTIELGVNGLVGSIICSHFTTPYNKSYIIQFTVDGGSRVIGMYNVYPNDVVYVPSKSCIDDHDGSGKNEGTVDTKLQSNVKTGNSLSTGVIARREMDKTYDYVDDNLRKQPSTVKIQQSLMTSASHLPLVSCDSASSSLPSEEQQEAVSLDIRQDTSTPTTTTAAESKRLRQVKRRATKKHFKAMNQPPLSPSFPPPPSAGMMAPPPPPPQLPPPGSTQQNNHAGAAVESSPPSYGEDDYYSSAAHETRNGPKKGFHWYGDEEPPNKKSSGGVIAEEECGYETIGRPAELNRSLTNREERLNESFRVDESSNQKPISVVETSLQRVSPLTACSFEYTPNCTKRKLSWEPPPTQTKTSEDKKDCSLPVHKHKNMEVTFEIPRDYARYIVGRGGATMTAIEQDTGCRIDIEGMGTPSAVGMRTVTLTAHNSVAISECRAIIENMISRKRIMVNNSLTSLNADVEHSRVSKKIFIPADFDYMELIGSKGKKHRELVASSGGALSISLRGVDSNGNLWNGCKRGEPLHIMLDGRKASVDKAERLIMKLLEGYMEETLANRKRKSLLDTESLSEHSIEHPRKSCKIMGMDSEGTNTRY